MLLTATVVNNRPGYVNEAGQVYSTPLSNKRIQSWMAKMRKQGYKFAGEA